MAKAKAKAKKTGTGKAASAGKAATGRLRAKRETAGRTARAVDLHAAEVRERINEALKTGKQLRRQIEQRIDAGLKERRR